MMFNNDLYEKAVHERHKDLRREMEQLTVSPDKPTAAQAQLETTDCRTSRYPFDRARDATETRCSARS